MFLSAFGRFRTVFKQTVTTSRHVTRHHKLLSKVAIVGANIFVALAAAEELATDQARIYEMREQIYAATPPTPSMFTWQAINTMAIDKNVADLVKETCPAVVCIERHTDLGERGRGSGFFIDEVGLILTNAHVVGECKTVFVLTTDDRLHQGVVESCDKNIDLALVRVQADINTKEFPSIKLGDSSKMRRNDFVMAIGYPSGYPEQYKQSLMTGVISSAPLSSKIIKYKFDTKLSRVSMCLFPRGIKVIRSNIIANPGASGAPAINQNGEAVGVLFSRSHNYDKERPDGGFLFSTTLSIPSNTAKKFLAKAKMKELEWVSLCLCQGGTSFSNFDYFLWSEG